MKNKYFCEHEKVYYNYIDYCVKYKGTECKFIYPENIMVSVIEVRIHFGTFWIILDDINV